MVLNEVRILLIEKSRLVAEHLLLNHEAFNYLNSPIKVLVTYVLRVYCCNKAYCQGSVKGRKLLAPTLKTN